MTPDQTPPPGSDEAVAQGCTCPILDNAHGKGYYGMAGIYVLNAECPLHSSEPEPEPEPEL